MPQLTNLEIVLYWVATALGLILVLVQAALNASKEKK